MKGFIQCNKISRNLFVHDGKYLFAEHDEFDKYAKWNVMRKAGISPYTQLNFYVSDIFGAWMGNIDSSITNISDLVMVTQYDLDEYTAIPYQSFIDEGYELVIGPGVPETDGKIYGNGVYCKNWQEIVNKNTSTPQKVFEFK